MSYVFLLRKKYGMCLHAELYFKDPCCGVNYTGRYETSLNTARHLKADKAKLSSTCCQVEAFLLPCETVRTPVTSCCFQPRGCYLYKTLKVAN